MAGKRSLMKLKKLIEKLKICLNLLHQVMPLSTDQVGSSVSLVPAGHFTVVAGKGLEDGLDNQRFVVELKYLRSPALLKLLKEAEEEYGFNQQGALVLPCTPNELRDVLQN